MELINRVLSATTTDKEVSQLMNVFYKVFKFFTKKQIKPYKTHYNHNLVPFNYY